MEKLFVSAEDLLRDSYELALRIFESGYRPSFIIGVWRGGAPVGIAVQEVLSLLGCPANHAAIRTSAYEGIDQPSQNIAIYGIQNLVEMMGEHEACLIIDDIFDTGRSIDAILTELSGAASHKTLSAIKTATVYYKPHRNQTARVPDFYVHTTDEWVVFPHELEGCTHDELRRTKPLPERIYKLLS